MANDFNAFLAAQQARIRARLVGAAPKTVQSLPGRHRGAKRALKIGVAPPDYTVITRGPCGAMGPKKPPCS